jgi:hypothetical protein
MGVWSRSPLGRKLALQHQGLRTEYDHALPGWNEDDA